VGKFEDLAAEKARWDDFAKRLGVKAEDMQIQSLQCLLTIPGDTPKAGCIGGRDHDRKRAMMPLWLRDQILAKTTWREQDKPKIEAVSNG